ncbi:GGDEF domain-containing protein [Legionella spiritensis]|uniref:diguanylate cyclase n=1 Tax=Legionella spiritensis TaxID=452 RepID=A0A0W0YZE8_LEGSP|nr:GGDEF domain-containing protein [Legionella spiritensis]KTD62030.1 GGDEF domain-containing protein [Legionella spiritensis]SNV34635.1 diguanylate cyclase [Legionella spiritensis]
MIDQQIKRKIVNTISSYEEKCDHLRIEINTLKSALSELLTLPTGVDDEVDRQLLNLQEDITTGKDPDNIQQRIIALVEMVKGLKRKPDSQPINIRRFIRQSTDLLQDMVVQLKDSQLLANMEQMFQDNPDDEQLMNRLVALLGQCNNVLAEKTTGYRQQNNEDNPRHDGKEIGPQDVVISRDVNQSLEKLLAHLAIPDELGKKLDELKAFLQGKITGELLPRVIDGLTELVIDAFSLEQNQFKIFLCDLTTQLHDFDNYLLSTNIRNKEARQNVTLLESGIQSNIKEIKKHVDNSTGIKELSGKIHQNLLTMGQRIQEYTKEEEKRFQDHENEVKALKEQLMEAERHAREIQNALSFQQVKLHQDSLTGLPNRAAYDESIFNAYQRWQRGFGELSLAIADIDHFKAINDNYGHLAGDKVLQKVASIFKNSVRETDFIARYGGEEFIFIFERTSQDNAKSLIETLRRKVEKCQFCYSNEKVDVTVSFGMTVLRPGEDLETLFIRADTAMYKAKRAGRNRVETL